MKILKYTIILTWLLSLNALANEIELKPIDSTKTLPLTKEEILQAQNSDGKYLAKKGYYNPEEYFKQITEIKGAIAYFANTSAASSPPYYNVLIKDDKGYFFKKYSYASKEKKLIAFDNRRPSSFKDPEIIYLKESSVTLLLYILKTELSQAKEVGRMGFDSSTYDFGMLIDGKWQKAGAWTPLEGTMPFKLANCISIYTQDELEKCLKTLLNKAPQKAQTLKEKYTKDGILILKPNETCEIDTRASIYHKYKVQELSKDFIFLNSSDIGTYMFCKKASDKWDKFYTKHIKIKDTNIYIIFPENKFNNNDPFNTITLLFEKDGTLKKTTLAGEFYMYKNFHTIKEYTLIISDGTKLLPFNTKSIFTTN